MAENDIYNSQKKYERFKVNYNAFDIKPDSSDKKRKYYCKNKINLKFFETLFTHFEATDISYARRNRLLNTFKVILFLTEKELSECNRDDINKILAYTNNTFNSPKSRSDFIKDLKHMWKIVLPELDEKNRPDESIIPYVVRHLSSKIDKSKEKARSDKMGSSPEEILETLNRLVSAFSNDPRMQAYLMLSWDSLARPQELLYLRKKDVELKDNYANIFLAEHGKEGTKRIQCSDSYEYLVNWLNKHPLKNSDAFLFVNLGNTNTYKQMTPENANKLIRTRCKKIGLDHKKITNYSIKRNGITYLDAVGTSATDIQLRAGWTSTDQLKIYSKKDQDMAFMRRLAEQGKLPPEEAKKYLMPENLSRSCTICGHINKFTNEYCDNCKRPLDRKKLLNEDREVGERISALEKQLENYKKNETDIEYFLQFPEVQELFKMVYKMKRQLDNAGKN